MSHGLELTCILCQIQFDSLASGRKDFFKVVVTSNDYVDIGYESTEFPGEN